MNDEQKTKAELIDELKKLRQQYSHLQKSKLPNTKNKDNIENKEKYFESLFENAPLAYQSLDESGHLLDVNEAWCLTFGYEKKKVIGKNIAEFIHPDYHNHLKKNFPKFKKLGRIFGVEFKMLKKDGSEIIVSVNGKIGYHPDQTFKQTHCILHDITQQKQNEDEIKRSKTKYFSLFNLSGDAIMLFRNGKFINCNQAALQMFNCPSEEEYCKLHPADISPKTQPCGTDSLTLSEKRMADAIKNDNNRFEWMHQKLNGETFPTEVMLSSIILNKQRLIQAMVRDISDRKQAEKRLQESEQRYHELFNSLIEGVGLVDQNETIIFCNPAYASIFEEDSPEAMIGKNLLQYIPEKDHQLIRLESEKRKIGVQSQYELEIQTAKGNSKTILTSVNPKYDNNKNYIGALGTFIDITEEKRLRNQESRAQRLESAGRVAGQIAHDFNNLLAPLVAYPDFIKEGLPDNHPTIKYINDMEKSANQIAEINQQLLTLSRRGHYNQEILNLNEVIKFAIDEIGILPQTVVIETDFANNLMNIKGGSAQIHRVLTNLIHNARDAMQDVGNITIKTQNYYVDNPTINFARIPKGEYVKITISDIGCGIPKDIRQNIFDPFFSTKSSDRKRGSGLGLSVVDAVIKDHNGFIDIKSKIGDGTSFYLYFPITRELVEETEKDKIIGGNESILVVDDDKVQCDVALRLLNKLGYNANAVNSGEEAVEYLKNNQQDLILLDMIMPGGIDGTETYSRIIKTYPNQDAIFISGYAESSRVDEARKLGVSMYIRKPLTLKLLAISLRKILDKKEIIVSTV